jgi:hypothetical protein
MYFEVEHLLDASVDEIAAAMFHPDYLAFMVAHHEILTGAKPQTLEDSSTQIKRRVHYKARPAFDHVGFKEVPADWFEFVEQSTWDKRAHKLSFQNVPVAEKVAERFLNRGEISLEPMPSGKTRRRTKAEIKLHSLPLLVRPMAPMVEQMVAREAKRLLEIEARIMNEWVAAGRNQARQATASA